MSVDEKVLKCSTPSCVSLFTMGESIWGGGLRDPAPGRYCVDCARTMGHFTPEDVRRLESLLIGAGMLPVPRRESRRRVKVDPQQETMFDMETP